MTPKLFKAGEVCDIAQLQPFVLRSWEKEFPGIGVQKSNDSPRFYRQSDVDQLLRIKRLVFGEGLTLAGARRRLEESRTPTPARRDEAAAIIEVLGADARTRIAHVRDGLRSLLHLLSIGNGEGYRLTPPPVAVTPRAKVRPVAPHKSAPARTKGPSRHAARGKTTAKRRHA